jgi:hypothetical protein
MECPGEELAPKGPDFGERAGPPVAAVRRGGKGRWRDGRHDAARLLSVAACAALEAPFEALIDSFRLIY